MKEDYIFNILVFSTISFFITLGFAIYNIVLAIIYKYPWNIGISIYYVLLLIIRMYVILSEYGLNKYNFKEKEEKNRKNLYLSQSILLLIIDLALITPISLMVLQEKEVNYSEITAITIAAYTFYKIIMSLRNYIKTKKINHLSIKIIRSVNLIDSLVSILSLQYTLIMTFKSNADMSIFTYITSFIIWIIIVIISILNLINAIKIKKNKL